MLEITVAARELYDELKNEFVSIPETKVRLEHSLISISKWEARWKIPFFDSGIKSTQKTKEQVLDYIRCMIIDQNVNPAIINYLTKKDYDRIQEYIGDSQTATWFSDEDKRRGPNRTTLTSELIYYYMVAAQVPFECEKWHISRLLTLLKICGIKSNPPKKMNKKDMLSQRKALNEARRKEFGTRG